MNFRYSSFFFKRDQSPGPVIKFTSQSVRLCEYIAVTKEPFLCYTAVCADKTVSLKMRAAYARLCRLARPRIRA